MTLHLSVDQILALYEGLVDEFGGSRGLRDRALLESAAAKPAMTFGGDDLYPDIAAKAAALMHSLVLSHPFVDGNKRIGVHAAEFFVERNGSVLVASDREIERLTVAVAAGEIGVEALTIWIRQRLRAVE